LQRTDLPKVCTSPTCIRVAEVCVVECIERFHAELDSLLPVDPDPLEQREIGRQQCGTTSECAWRVAKGVSRVLRERTRVKPLSDSGSL